MRLIDADALERMGYVLTRTYQQDHETMVYETKKLSDMPSAQPERKTGRWETVTNNPWWAGGGYWKCSNCNYGFSFEAYHEADEWHYCPNCGAKMEVEHETDNRKE